MFAAEVHVFPCSYYKDVFGRDKAGKALHSLLDKGFADAQDIEELLGVRYPAYRPKAAADAASHNGYVGVFSVLCHCFSLL